MKCPLLTDKNYGVQLERTMATGDCIKEECAWWHEGRGNCCIWAIETALDVLGVLLAKLVKQVPHEGQFRK